MYEDFALEYERLTGVQIARVQGEPIYVSCLRCGMAHLFTVRQLQLPYWEMLCEACEKCGRKVPLFLGE